MLIPSVAVDINDVVDARLDRSSTIPASVTSILDFDVV